MHDSRHVVAAATVGLLLVGCGSRVHGATDTAPVAEPSGISAPAPEVTATPGAEPSVSAMPSAAPSGTPTPGTSVSAPGPSWSPRPVRHTSPGIRVGAATIPFGRAGVLLYGGQLPASGRRLADTWSWNGVSWRRLSVSGPDTPYGPALGADPRTGRPVLLAGGSFVHEGSTDPAYGLTTWTWTGADWRQLHPAHAVVSGAVLSTVADDVHDRLLAWIDTAAGDMAKGGTANQTDSTQMWSWDGRDWTRLYAHTADGGRTSVPQLAVPGPAGTIVGIGHGTFRWTGRAWQSLTVPGDPTEATAAGYDPVRHIVIVLGQTQPGVMIADQGITDDGTYLYDGRTWARQGLPTALRSRQGPVTVWDAADGGLLFGYGEESVGNTARQPSGYDDSWLFTPTGWHQLTA